MNTLILSILFLVSSCASKYIKDDPKMEDIPDEMSAKVTVAQPKVKKIKTTVTTDTKTNKVLETKVEELNPEIPAIKVPWKVGEKLQYKVSAIGMNAAHVDIEVMPMKMLNNQRVWHFNSQAKTQNMAANLYYFNSKAESFVTEQLKSLEFRSSSFEGNSKKTMVEKYDLEKSQYFAYKKKDDKVEINKSKDQDYKTSYVDLVYLFYYIRMAQANDEFQLLNNHKSKKIKIVKVENEVLDYNNTKINVDKFTFSYDGKSHYIYRDKTESKKIIKAVLDLKFASGTMELIP